MLGSIITLLTTPKTGPEMRDSIKDLVNRETEKARGKFHELEGKVEGKVAEAVYKK